jgi:serine-threonine kinase receptor-associated protein
MSIRQVPLICSGHSRPVPDLAYSPITEDGFYIISACLDGKPMLRNGENGDWIGTFEGHKGAVWCARLNPEASLALTGSADYTAKLWDALSGSELRSFAHKRIVKAVDISQDSKQVVTGGQEKTLFVWDTEKGVCTATLPGHQSFIKQVLWTSDHMVLSGGADEAIRVWDLRSMLQVKSCTAKAPVASIELSRDGKYLTTAAGKEVTFWDAASLIPLKMYTLGQELNSASLHPSSLKFVVGGADFYVHVYDFATGEELEVHKGHHGPVHCVRFSPDGETYASGSEDGTIRLWQTTPKSYGLWQTSSNQNSNHVHNLPSTTPPKK